MALARTVVSEGLIDELDRFEELVRPLTAKEWDTPSRCEGWTVGDVARHVIGSMADVAAGRLDGLGSPEVTKREVDERAGRSPAELADECAEVTKAAAGHAAALRRRGLGRPRHPGGFDGTLGDGVEALWYDTWMHADDIRAALGQKPVMSSGFAGRPFARGLGSRAGRGLEGRDAEGRRRSVRVHHGRDRPRRRLGVRRRRAAQHLRRLTRLPRPVSRRGRSGRRRRATRRR